MADVFRMPKLGETVTTGTVTRWLRAVGDTVGFDDPLLEVATDKVDSEIPSPYSGVVLEIMVPEGETVAVGAELARIGPPAESGPTPSPAAPVAALSTPVTPATSSTSASSTSAASSVPPNGRAKLSPIVRKLAARHGIDLGAIQGSGATGRITREDIEAAIARAGAAQATPPGVTAAATQTPVAAGPRDEVQPLSRMRLAIAERMTESLRTAPHVWTAVEVDLQAVEEVRREHKERFRREEGTSLTYLAFVARAACDALRAFPVVNSSLDMAARTRIPRCAIRPENRSDSR